MLPWPCFNLHVVYLLQAIIETQNRLQNYIDGFRFNLGFSGKFFHRGSPEENRGDDALIGKLVLTKLRWLIESEILSIGYF